MCSNFQAITAKDQKWVSAHFQCELPYGEWHEEIYPGYPAPFIWLDGSLPKCELALFGLVPGWAAYRPRFGMHTYNSRSESTHEKPSYRHAWKHCQFGLAIMSSFYEPCYETGKAVRWRINRADGEPMAVPCIWERYVDRSTGQIVMSFSMLTINADGHAVMGRFHPGDEKRSIVVLNRDFQYSDWLLANQDQARSLLKLAPDEFLTSEAAPRK